MGSDQANVQDRQREMATYKVSTGRGGAGNIQKSSSKASPRLVPQGSQTPSILQPVFSTGRGGAGNMRRNVDAKLTRRAQDVDDEEDIIEPSKEEDYIEPFTGADVERAVSAGVISRGTSSRDTGKSHLRSVRSKRNSLEDRDRPVAIAVGRGGAGNIISPKPSRSGVKKKNKPVEEKKKGGVWSSVKKLFS